MGYLGDVYRKIKSAIEPKIIPEIDDVSSISIFDNTRVLIVGDGLTVQSLRQSFVNARVCVDCIPLSGPSLPDDVSLYDMIVVGFSLPALLICRGSVLEVQQDAFQVLEKLYFANQFAVRHLSDKAPGILDVVFSSGNYFWKQEVEGITEGLAMSIAPKYTANAIHVISENLDGPFSASAALSPDLFEAISMLCYGAASMSTGNTFEVVV